MSRGRRYASHLLCVQRILCRGSRGVIARRTARTRSTICQYYKPEKPDICEFWCLRSGLRLGPARSFRTVVNIPREVIREGAFNPLRRFRLRIWGASFLFLPTSGGESFSSSSSSSSSSDEEEVSSLDDMSGAPFSQGPFLAPLAAFPGCLLWHLIRCGKKHFRQ